MDKNLSWTSSLGDAYYNQQQDVIDAVQEMRRRAARGYAEPRGQSSVRSGAFSGYGQGGQTRSFSSRGSASIVGRGARGGKGARNRGGERL